MSKVDMPHKTKYNYDIKKIEDLQNEGHSIREIARILGFCEISTQAWINRNFHKNIKYSLKFKGE